MKRIREPLAWAGFLVLAGVFLLLKNLGVFGTWGDLAWGALFALAGLGFLVWFLTGVDRWWRAIPAFMLLGIGAIIIARWREVDLSAWDLAIVLFGMALGFWAVLLARREHWWALIPAGVLTVLGVLVALWTSLAPGMRVALLELGIGFVFVLLYLIRYEEADTRWAAIPAAALLLLGLVNLIENATLPPVLSSWWPILLVIGGLVMAVIALALRGTREPKTAAAGPDFDAMPPAPGTSVTQVLPEADLPSKAAQPVAAPPPAPATQPPVNLAPAEPAAKPTDESIDIYDLIKQQPNNEPPPEKK
jgi:hypothetical protein